jgi:hypothetical protein
MYRDLRFVVAAAMGLLACAGAALAGDMMADRHSVRGVGCAECHGKSAPPNAVTSAACVACHGTSRTLAATPATPGRNPHAVVTGARDCLDCHHAHRP